MLDILLKIVSLLVIVTGAFLVYGAKYIAELKGGEYENRTKPKVLTFKTTGLLILMAGGILALVAFK